MICIFSVDRSEDATWRQHLHFGISPTLTCSNKFLFILSTHDIEEDCMKRQFSRFMHPCERLLIQGFSREVAKHLSPDTCIKAAGNADPPPLICAAFGPMIARMKDDDNIKPFEPNTCKNPSVKAQAFKITLTKTTRNKTHQNTTTKNHRHPTT